MAALRADTLVLVGSLVVALRAEGVRVLRARAVEQAGAHVHTQRPQPPRRAVVPLPRARLLAPLALLLQRALRAPHLARARLHLRAQVQAHVAQPRAVRVAAPHAAQRRRPQVQVAVLQQEGGARLGARHQRVRAVVVPAARRGRQRAAAAPDVAADDRLATCTRRTRGARRRRTGRTARRAARSPGSAGARPGPRWARAGPRRAVRARARRRAGSRRRCRARARAAGSLCTEREVSERGGGGR